MSLKKVCARAGCNRLIDYEFTHCPEHQNEFEKKQKQRHRDYKHQRQDKDEQAFYCSNAWLLTRDYIKGKYKGLCLYSYYILNEILFCDVVHHITELKEDWELRLNEDNLITLSDGVHNLIHAAYKTGKKEEIQKLLRELRVLWEKEFNDILLK